jgi:pyruvate,water dikinase
MLRASLIQNAPKIISRSLPITALLWAFFAAPSCDGGDGTGAGAGGGGAGGAGGAGGTPSADCMKAEEVLGKRACVNDVPDAETWKAISIDSNKFDEVRLTKYLAPAREGARVGALFMDAHAFTKHDELLRQAFPDAFAGLTPNEYNQLILDKDREFFAGSLTQYIVLGETVLYGYTVWEDPTDEAAAVTCEMAKAAHAELDGRFGPAPLAFVPFAERQRAMLEGCAVPSYDPESSLAYEPYTVAVGYGRVHRYTLAELAAATSAYSFNWQNVLVLEEAPFDIETVIAGAVTGSRQGELSHLNVRSAARGTPNCYLQDAHTVLAGWDGKLVRFECGQGAWSIDGATEEEAQAFWDKLKPAPVTLPDADLAWAELTGLLELPTASKAERAAGFLRYGSKGTNLATLAKLVDPAHRFDGFLIPFSKYDAFMKESAWMVDVGSGPQKLTFADTIAAWLKDPHFLSDGKFRRARLDSLRSAMKDAPVSPSLLSAIGERIVSTFGSDKVMARFRSSSNAEDSLDFSGAGLYTSASGCLADDLDGDKEGPSHCDPSEADEKPVAKALAKVWGSLWNMEAFEERSFYSIDHSKAFMGVLVNPRTKDEQANIVAFSGNPTTPNDSRWLVNAQIGALDVVGAPPGVFPERDLLTIEGGKVVAIDRVSGSSELPAGAWVLDDARLSELGSLFAGLAAVFPNDYDVPPGRELLFDTEWKIDAGGQLIIKQIRPFLK